MKKSLATAMLLMYGVGGAYACKILQGSANLVSSGAPGTYSLSCPGKGECAKLNCNGTDIDIYIGGRTLHGTLASPVVATNNADGTATLSQPVLVKVNPLQVP